MPRIVFKKRKRTVRTGKEKKMSFSSKEVPKEGVIAILMGIFSLLLFVILVIYSTYKRGEADIFAGAVGLIAFFTSLVGFGISLRTMKRDNIVIKFPVYGVLVNTISLFIYLILYFYGIILMMG